MLFSVVEIHYTNASKMHIAAIFNVEKYANPAISKQII
jgi:hypothetical protein